MRSVITVKDKDMHRAPRPPDQTARIFSPLAPLLPVTTVEPPFERIASQATVWKRRPEPPVTRRESTAPPVLVRIRTLDFDGQKIFSSSLHDITERKRAEQARGCEARRDALTGLPNRRALFELLPHAIARSDRGGSAHGTALALFSLNLDRVNAVNDAWGRGAGDNLLREVARRLSLGLRQTDFVARLAGNQFIVVLEGLSIEGRDDAICIAENLLASIQEPVQIGTQSAQVGASIGIAFHMPCTTTSPDELFKNADMAMYTARGAAQSTICMQ